MRLFGVTYYKGASAHFVCSLHQSAEVWVDFDGLKGASVRKVEGVPLPPGRSIRNTPEHYIYIADEEKGKK